MTADTATIEQLLTVIDGLQAEVERLQGRIAAMADHHDAEHEKCGRAALAKEEGQ